MSVIERLIPPEWREQIRRDIYRTPLSRAYTSISEYLSDAARTARELELISARGPLSHPAVILVAVVRNEIQRLPGFLSHYRRLGIDRFMFIDNDSSDG